LICGFKPDSTDGLGAGGVIQMMLG